MRRVRPTPGNQLALFTAWDYHAFITDRAGDVLEIEAEHRRHAVVEQTIAELKSAGLAHMPSGNFMATAAWLALTVMEHNRGRAVGHLAGPDLNTATAATLRRKVFTMPRRLVHRADDANYDTAVLAMGRCDHHRPEQHSRDPAALLNNTTRPDDQDFRTSRQTGSSRTPTGRRTPPDQPP